MTYTYVWNWSTRNMNRPPGILFLGARGCKSPVILLVGTSECRTPDIMGDGDLTDNDANKQKNALRVPSEPSHFRCQKVKSTHIDLIPEYQVQNDLIDGRHWNLNEVADSVVSA
eukprot:scaffold173772_cov19-Tisochrysis_lutea.AAC.1